MILMIDDNREFNELICEFFTENGFTVASALSGEEGFAKAKLLKPRLIFCDIKMPGMDGYEVAQRIRQEETLKDVYLVAITGNVGADCERQSLTAGFDLHLNKPVRLDVFMKILEDLP